nr:unknown [Medicago truncatula]
MWNCLEPSVHRVLSLVAKIKSLEKDKEHLRINLHKAEEEVKLLFDENSIVDKANKRISKKCKERNDPSSGEKHTSSPSSKSNKRKSSPKTSSPVEQKERNHPNSSEKHTSSRSAKSNKRTSSPRTSSSVERKIDFDDQDSERQPLSPLRYNSTDCRIRKQ